MGHYQNQTITQVTRRAIFKAMRQKSFPWWGESSEADLLGQVFELAAMESFDSRQSNAEDDIRVHRDIYRDWEDDWIFHDERLDLINCDDYIFLRLFETMLHPCIQPEHELVTWLRKLLDLHLARDGWRLEQISVISGKPVYEARRRNAAELTNTPQYIVPNDFDIELETYLYSVSRVFAYRGQTTQVAILADAYGELTQIDYDNLDGGTYTYSLALGIAPPLYAQIADERLDYASRIRDELEPHFPRNRRLQEVLIRPFQKAPTGWQEKAKIWVGGKGITNQGRVRSTNIAGREHDGLLFRSQPEINLYEALKKRGVAFAPLPVFLRGGENYQRLEPDFIIIKEGVFSIVEVDGDSFHPETPSAARIRLKLLEDAGAYIIRVNASECNTSQLAEVCADGLIRDIENHKKNRR